MVQHAIAQSRERDPFDGITGSDVEDAAADNLVIDESDCDDELVIDREQLATL